MVEQYGITNTGVRIVNPKKYNEHTQPIFLTIEISIKVLMD